MAGSLRPTQNTDIRLPSSLLKAVWEVQQEQIAAGFIALKVMPVFRVLTQQDFYRVMPIESLFNTHNTKRQSDGHYNRISNEFEQGIYSTEEEGLESVIDDRDLAMYSTLFEYQLATSTILMDAILRRFEQIVAALYFPGSFTPTTVSTSWATIATADPLLDINAGKKSLRDSKGVHEDSLTLVTNHENFENLRNNAKIRAAIDTMFADTTKTGNVTKAQIEAYLKTPIEVAAAQVNSAKKNQDVSLGDVWDKNYAMLAVLAPEGSDLSRPSAGRTVLWNEGDPREIIVEQYRDDTARADVLRVRWDVDPHFITSRQRDLTAISTVSEDMVYLMDGVNP